MARKFIAYEVDAPYLLPPDLNDWLPDDHLARFIKEVVQRLDLEPFYRSYDSVMGRGRPPHHPAMMLSLLLYGYSTGVYSSRKIERATYESVAFRFLAANQHPDHDCIAAFRRRHLDDIKGVFASILLFCRESGLVKLGHIAIDGTRLKANASRKKTMNEKQLAKFIRKQEKKIASLLEKAEDADQEEASDDHRVELAREERKLDKLQQAQTRLVDLKRKEEARIKEHEEKRAEMEAVAKAAKKSEQAERRAAGAFLQKTRKEKNLTQKQLAEKSGLGRCRISCLEIGRYAPTEDEFRALKAALETELQPYPERTRRPYFGRALKPKSPRENLTDPDSKVMTRPTGGSIQAYNPQIAVDAKCQIIVALGLSNSPSDRNNLLPMVSAVQKNLGRLPENISADAGYCSISNLSAPILDGVNVLVPPEKRQKVYKNPNPTIQAMREKLADDAQRTIYNQRSQTVEAPFGHIKVQRNFKQFLLRGWNNVFGEWNLVCLAHNLLKLHKYG